MKRIVLGAHALDNDGEAVLLRMLLPALIPYLAHAFVDARFAAEARQLVPAMRLTAVAPTLLARIAALRLLARLGEEDDRLFCFTTAPPLVSSRMRTILYVSSAFLAPKHPLTRWSAGDQARLAFERLLLRLGSANVDEFWTPTPHMARTLASIARGRRVRAMPVFDMPLPAPTPSARPEQEHVFFCPTGGSAYINHTVLYRAWALLADERLTPRLEVMLEPDTHARWLRAAGLSNADAPRIANLGTLDRPQSLERLAAADTLIFPSAIALHGIPVIEATAFGKPVLAPERSDVRDVCVPAQTFNPQDPYSIADAVRRFLGYARAPVLPLTPEQLVQTILA